MQRKKIDNVYPFTAIVGQEKMKEAIVLNLINPALGGVLIRGQKGTAKTTVVRAIPNLMHKLKIVEIPANATEDRVAGTINIEAALKDGEKKFEPGLLKEADGNILYVDEVNLLDDHIVDLLLDAAATGRNTVEREGISCTHASKFILIGSMNPEEGNLRPQLLDRFGMVVDVTAEEDVDKRIQIVKNRLAYEQDASVFCKRFEERQAHLRTKIDKARALLPEVTMNRELLRLSAEICIAYGTDGHRADIGIVKTAKTIAAYEGRKRVKKEDISRAAQYVLPHRMHKNPLDNGQMNPEMMEQILSRKGEKREPETSGEQSGRERSIIEVLDEMMASLELSFSQKRASQLKIKKGKHSGSVVPSEAERNMCGLSDVDIPATIRTCVERGSHMDKDGLQGQIMPVDLRMKRYRHKKHSTVLFVVDASRSQGANKRLAFAKGAVMAMLEKAYCDRDRVGLILFGDKHATMKLPFTKSVDVAAENMRELKAKGNTPLAMGLRLAAQVQMADRRKYPEDIHLTVLITDGKSNYDTEPGNPVKLVYQAAENLRKNELPLLVIDTENSIFGMGIGARIAELVDGAYVKCAE